MSENRFNPSTVTVGGFPVGGSPTARKEGNVVKTSPTIADQLLALGKSQPESKNDDFALKEKVKTTIAQVREHGLDRVEEIPRDDLRKVIAGQLLTELNADVYALIKIAFARLDVQKYEDDDNWLEKQRANDRLEMRIGLYTEIDADGTRKLKPNAQLFKYCAYSLN